MEDLLKNVDKQKLQLIDEFYASSLKTRNRYDPNYYFNKYRYLYDDMKKVFHHLYDHIDWELKRNDELNKVINESVSIDEILNFDIKNYFCSFDEDGNVSFNSEKWSKAVEFYKNWPQRKHDIQSKIENLQSKTHFQSFYKRSIDKLNIQLKNGEYKFKYLSAIFELERKFNSSDIEFLKSKLTQLKELIKNEIDNVMTKHILSVIKEHPELILSKQMFQGNYYIQSSAFLSNENNKNLPKYYNYEILQNKLDTIYINYLKNKSMGEISATKDK